MSNCTHPDAELQLVCEMCGHREAAPDRSQVELLAAALTDLQREVLPVNPERYRLMAEPIIAQIMEMIGVDLEAVRKMSAYWSCEGPEHKKEQAWLDRVQDRLVITSDHTWKAIDMTVSEGASIATWRCKDPATLDEIAGYIERQRVEIFGAQTIAALISFPTPSPWTFLYDRRPDDGQKVIVWCLDDPTAEPWIESGKYLAVEEEFEFSHSILPTGLRGVLIFWRPDDLEPPTADQIKKAKEEKCDKK